MESITYFLFGVRKRTDELKVISSTAALPVTGIRVLHHHHHQPFARSWFSLSCFIPFRVSERGIAGLAIESNFDDWSSEKKPILKPSTYNHWKGGCCITCFFFWRTVLLPASHWSRTDWNHNPGCLARHTKKQTHKHTNTPVATPHKTQTNKQANAWGDKHTTTQTYEHTNKHTNKHTDKRQTHTKTGNNARTDQQTHKQRVEVWRESIGLREMEGVLLHWGVRWCSFGKTKYCLPQNRPVEFVIINVNKKPCTASKLTWLVLGWDPVVCSHRVEQFTALWGL